MVTRAMTVSNKKTIDFLREIVPFNELPNEVLEDVAGRLEVQRFPKGKVVLNQGGVPCEYLYIIKNGAVEKTVQRNGKNVLLAYSTEGDFFGSASLINGTGPAFSVKTFEDTVCYVLPKEMFDTLMQNHLSFHEHFAIRVSRLAYRLKKAKTGIFASGAMSDTIVFRPEGELFSVRARELLKRKPVTCSPYYETRAVANLMGREGVGAVVVADSQKRPLGIVTKSDMTYRVLASGKSGADPIRKVMTSPIVSVTPEEPCFNVLLKMAGFDCHHVCVVDDNILLGVVSQHDLIMLQGADPLAIVNDIEKQTSIDGLVESVGAMDRIVERLLKGGVPTREATAFISECNDRLTKRIIALSEAAMVEEGLGLPPVPYCWLALGSEGRKEQTLRTDQDNAIIFSDPKSTEYETVQAYFLNLAERVVSALERCGFPLCKGNIMASNPQWCESENIWKGYFSKWVNEASPEDLRNCTIFFDFRPLTGALELAEQLRAFLNDKISGNRAFLRHLATNALYHGPPLGFLRTLVVEKTGEHKNELNLKTSGLVPVVDAMRVFALSQQIDATNTLERLEGVRIQQLLSDEMAGNIREAFGFVLFLRMSRHLLQKEHNRDPSDYVNPKTLLKLQKKSLIEAFYVIRDLQGELEDQFPETL